MIYGRARLVAERKRSVRRRYQASQSGGAQTRRCVPDSATPFVFQKLPLRHNRRKGRISARGKE